MLEAMFVNDVPSRYRKISCAPDRAFSYLGAEKF
jgi:hypothetical protein